MARPTVNTSPHTLNHLMKKTPATIKGYADDTKIVSSKKIVDSETGMPTVIAVVQSTHDSQGRLRKDSKKHRCFIMGLEGPKKPINQSRVKLSCDCLSGDTRVLTTSGWKSIYELAEPLTPGIYRTEYVVNGSVVLGSAPFYKGKAKTLELTLDTGSKIRATPDHKFLVQLKNGRKVWRRLRKLSVGDWLVPNVTAAPAVSKDSSSYLDAHLMGILMGDGSVFSGGAPDLKLYGDKRNDILELIAGHAAIENYYPAAKDSIQVRFNPRAKELMHRFKYRNKTHIELTTTDTVFGFLSGLLNTDGSLSRNGAKIDGGFDYLRILQDHLLSLGLAGSRLKLFQTNKKGTNTNFGERKHDVYSLFLPLPLLRSIEKNLLLSRKHREKLAVLLEITPQSRLPKTKVVEIKIGKKEPVYDITVPSGNRFVAEGVIVHNCEYFLFTVEYALNLKGNADLLFSNGKPAVVRNPENRPFLCKHLFHLSETLIQKGM